MGATGKVNAARLADIVAPRSVAVVGASEDLGKFGGRALHHLIKHGFQGRIVPINPKRPNLFGLLAAPTIVAAGSVDVALIALPADQLVSCIEDCATAGVRAAVIITAQMAEVGGEGATRQQRIVEVARASGMRIVGPNCLGLVNTRARLALTASFAMDVDRLPVGPIGVISQSGALMATMFSRGYDLGVGFSTLTSVGNQADVTENEVLEHLISDTETRAIVLYLEGVSDGARMLALAEQARAAGKPIIAVKAGRSEAGRRATYSHTASIAGSFKLFAAAARSRGIVITDEPESAILIADALVRWPAGLPRGRGIALARDRGAAPPLLRTGFAMQACPSLCPETRRAASCVRSSCPASRRCRLTLVRCVAAFLKMQ
jgi:acyl-CoA synthetase (NDP forming)